MDKTTKTDLGRGYSLATIRAHRLITDLYESLFDDKGAPIEDPQEVMTRIASFRQKLNIELDLAKETAYQFQEENYGFKGGHRRALNGK
tara:strand:+ start:1427 stop:1693 length:267 start_codon:yes stop_codon:yes gene_type:complete